MALFLLFITFLICVIFGIPIAFAMALASVVALAFEPSLNFMLMPQQMFVGANSFVFIAVPLFIIAGAIMEEGGIAIRLIRLAKALFAHIRGGLGIVVVVAEMFFSGISGATIADVSAMASMLIPSMTKAGYPPHYSTSIVGAASAMGILIPPCNLMVILGELMSVSVAGLFIGGVVPAVVLGVLLMVVIFFQAHQYNILREKRASFKEFLKSILDALIPLGMPAIIFGGILGGVCTPTEAAAIAVIYGLIVGLFIYKTLSLSGLWKILIDSSVISGLCIFLVGIASTFSYLLAYKHVPQSVADVILSISSNPLFFLMVSNIVLILIGCILDGLPAVIIFIPIFLPIAQQLHIDLLHYGILVIASIGIGLFLPPVGIGLLMACGIADVPMEPVMKPMLIFTLFLFIGLTVLTVFPWITTFLPNLVLK
jgi:C4-dicarboxylate transporter, DctM subunit